MTAYDMRISDWSSDVCSSDLPDSDSVNRGSNPRGASSISAARRTLWPLQIVFHQIPTRQRAGESDQAHPRDDRSGDRAQRRTCSTVDRSEEHTSELQSLMRISYAVFCLKKKKKKPT